MSRRPDALSNPQMWAEDGLVFFQAAYNDGPLQSLFVPYAGSLQTVQRIAASLAVLLPLALVPLFFNVAAIGIQILPAVMLWTPRFHRLIPDVRARALVTFLYLALPNTAEVHTNITNANWHLSLAALLVLLAPAPTGNRSRWFDRAVLALLALSGPFSFFLVPVALVQWYRNRDRVSLERSAILFVGAIIQGVVLIANPRVLGGEETSLGITLRIIDGQALLAPLLGRERAQEIVYKPAWMLAIVLLVAAVLVLYAAWKGPVALRLTLLFAGLLMGSFLFQPSTSGFWPAGISATIIGQSGRFFLAPMVAWLVSLVWMMWRGAAPFKLVASVLVASACVLAVPSDWQFRPYADFGYQTKVDEFNKLPAGASLGFPINPHEEWQMRLIKH